jgi:Fic family protein
MPSWIWEHTGWPAFHWRETEISPALARARLAQGRILGAASLLDPALTLDADASILVEDGLQTSAIEGERLDLPPLPLLILTPPAQTATRSAPSLHDRLRACRRRVHGVSSGSFR